MLVLTGIRVCFDRPRHSWNANNWVFRDEKHDDQRFTIQPPATPGFEFCEQTGRHRQGVHVLPRSNQRIRMDRIRQRGAIIILISYGERLFNFKAKLRLLILDVAMGACRNHSSPHSIFVVLPVAQLKITQSNCGQIWRQRRRWFNFARTNVCGRVLEIGMRPDKGSYALSHRRQLTTKRREIIRLVGVTHR